MREAIGIGETVEIATQKAYEALGVESAEIEVLELPEKKFLGLFGGKPAKVRAYVEDTPDAAAVAYLKSILAGMGAEKIEVTSEVTEDGAILNITGEDSGIVIGHHGETLDALQYLVGMAANHACEKYYRVTINVGDYREKREGTLCALAKRIAKKAITNGRRYSLEPMNPYERRIIHTAVQEIEGATSWSEGNDMDRHVVIGPEGGTSNRSGNRNNYRGKSGNSGRGRSNNRRPQGNRNSAPAEKKPAAQPAETAEATAPAVVEKPLVTETKKPIITDAPILGKSKETEKVPLYGRITPPTKSDNAE